MQKKQYYTKSALEKIKTELAGLKSVKRKEVAERIREAKAFGDLSENAEYADAKEAQAFVEGRIEELEEILENAEIVDDKCKQGGAVGVNCKVTVSDSKGGQREYTLVSANEVDPLTGKISSNSPIGKALMGKKVGDRVAVEVPSGKLDLQVQKIE